MQLLINTKRFLKRFNRSDKGNMAIISASMMMPLMMLMGGALDYSLAIKTRAEMSAALDAAVLAAREKLAADEGVDYEAVIDQVIDQNLKKADKGSDAYDIGVSDVVLSQEGELSAKLSAKVDTNFLPLMGIDDFDLEVSAAAMVGGSSIEVALVLDNTGSMKGGKLQDLKDAAEELIDAIMPDGQNEKVKVALVPFADYVNIGKDNRDEAGLDVPDNYSHTPSGQNCWNEYPNSNEQCTPVKGWTTCWNDGVPSDCYKTVDWDCTGDKGDPVQVCEDKPTKHYKFYGCMGSRPDADGNISEVPDGGAPGLMETWDWCKNINEITRLTNNKGQIQSGVSQMKAKRNTYIPSGLVWGWRLLSSEAPFADGVPYSNNAVNKVIVLMTDGANTKSIKKWGGKKVQNHNGEVWGHNKGDKNDANAKTAQLCSDIKDKGIMVYTIAFDVEDGSDIKGLLQNCAGNGGRYFDADDGTKLADAFKQIGLALLNLRLTK